MLKSGLSNEEKVRAHYLYTEKGLGLVEIARLMDRTATEIVRATDEAHAAKKAHENRPVYRKNHINKNHKKVDKKALHKKKNAVKSTPKQQHVGTFGALLKQALEG